MDIQKRMVLKQRFEYVLGFTVLVWVMIVNVAILTRYVFKIAIPWNEELTVLLFNWIIFIGAAMASVTKSHITITILQDALRGTTKKIVGIIQNILFIVFIAVVCFQSWKIVFLQARTEQFTAILNIPVYITTLAMSIGSLLWLFILLTDTYHLIKARPVESEASV
jgi:TRAP-type C4-dicarboxylate transport system permease small subunit